MAEPANADTSHDGSLEERIQDLMQQERDLIAQLTDEEEEDDFVRQYGDINYQYIKRPRAATWFQRPHALNFFKDGVLYRTKGERSSGKTELFLDLLYVGIIANVAGEAAEESSWKALLQYILVFIPYWTVWADIKDFTNYYYSEDLSQRLYIIWILVLLALSVNSHTDFWVSRSGAAYTIVPYILCRFSLAVSLLVYSFYIPEHRFQQRLYFCFLCCTCCMWIPVIFVGYNAKVALVIVCIFFEQVTFCIAFHPKTTKMFKVTMSTALNLEHEVERFATFVTIAIGEYLYKVVATANLGVGFTSAYGRGAFLLIIAYDIFWLYYNRGTTQKAVHPMRHSAVRAMAWIYLHVPLIGAIVLSADAGGDLLVRESIYHEVEPETESETGTAEALLRLAVRAAEAAEESEPPLRYQSFYFTGGIFVALTCIGLLGLLEDSKDHPSLHCIPQFWRVFPRIPVGVAVLCLSFGNLHLTLLFGLAALFLSLLLVYETVFSMPRRNPPVINESS